MPAVKFVPLLGAVGLVAVVAFGRPWGVDAVDPFDALGAVLACGLASVACWALPSWTPLTSIVVVCALALHLVDSCNRVAGYPDKEVWWALNLLWLPLVGIAWWRRMRLALAMIPVILATSWLAFLTRLAVYPVGPLRALEGKDAPWQPEPRATAKVSGGRVWVYSCVGRSPTVAVYRGAEDPNRALRPVHPERLESVAWMVDGAGSMDPQTANVPLPFERLVRCQ
jgi:hypothetical protein